MIFTLEALPAHKGDCLILHYGDADHTQLVLIDGGPNDTWHPHLRPRLVELREDRGLDDNRSLPVEIMMVSHVDDDHINGILDMAEELHMAKENQEPLFLQIHTLWHNGFDDILGNNQITAAVQGSPEAALAGIGGDESKILASINQGRALRDEAAFLGWTINSSLAPILSVNETTKDPIPVPGGLTLHMVGPRKSEIERLQKKHDKYLRDRGLGKDSPEAALAAFTDRSVANLSSLVMIAGFGGRSILLTGDARGDKVLKGLEEQGLIARGGTLEVDVLKMPHHGSDRNVTMQFFEQVRAGHYVFCGNGEHGNPERGCLEMLFDARPEGGFTLHFNYPLAQIDAQRKAEADHDWIPEMHGLAEFLQEMRDDGVVFEVVESTGSGVSVALGN